MTLGHTPSQTVGPFFSIALPWPAGPHAVPVSSTGAIAIRGRVLDGACEAVADALIETWQATHPPSKEFRGFTRTAVDDAGRFELVTLKPGPLDGGAPFIDVSVFARGLLGRCVTRIYFADEPEANARDPILGAIAAERRLTLLAQPQAEGYRFDIRLQGAQETVFFSV